MKFVDLSDVRAYDRAKQRLAAGEDELIPAEVANRLIDGENKIRVWREYRGMFGKELAENRARCAVHLATRDRHS